MVHSSLVSLPAHHPATKRGSGVAAIRPSGDRNDTTTQQSKGNRTESKSKVVIVSSIYIIEWQDIHTVDR